MTRADIARELRLSRSNLSPVILRLVHEGLLVPAGHDQSRGGRRGNLLSVGGAGAAVVAGLEIDADRVRVVVATLGIDDLARRHLSMDVTEDPEATLELAAQLIADCLEPEYGPLVAIGVSLAAAIDVDSGTAAVSPAMPRWVGVPVGDFLADRFSTRVFTDSDLNALAFSETIVPHRVPLGPAFLVVKANEGIGCGIVINNTVFRARWATSASTRTSRRSARAGGAAASRPWWPRPASSPARVSSHSSSAAPCSRRSSTPDASSRSR
jgi:hypothetical protein